MSGAWSRALRRGGARGGPPAAQRSANAARARPPDIAAHRCCSRSQHGGRGSTAPRAHLASMPDHTPHRVGEQMRDLVRGWGGSRAAGLVRRRSDRNPVQPQIKSRRAFQSQPIHAGPLPLGMTPSMGPALRQNKTKQKVGGRGPGTGLGLIVGGSGGCSFFFTLVTGPRRSLSLKLSDTRVYEPQIRVRLGTTAHFCEVVVLKLRAAPGGCSGGCWAAGGDARRVLQAGSDPSCRGSCSDEMRCV